MTKRMTTEQKIAVAKYWNKIASRDNYLASVFVEPVGIAFYSRMVAECAAACEQLGVPQIKVDTVPAPAVADHTKDSDCTVDAETGCCTVCGVSHDGECRSCLGRGFHVENCSEVSA